MENIKHKNKSDEQRKKKIKLRAATISSVEEILKEAHGQTIHGKIDANELIKFLSEKEKQSQKKPNRIIQKVTRNSPSPALRLNDIIKI